MNVLFEESGAFKVGAILTDNVTSMQVETAHGKRVKVKANAVLLHFTEPALTGFMQQAEQIAQQIDIHFLWECCSEAEFLFHDLARDYFGHPATPVEAAGVLLRLHSAPVYFYRKGKGRFKAAPPDTLKAALAAVERKHQQKLAMERMLDELKQFKLPEEFKPILPKLLYQPEANSIETKALEQASAAANLSIPRLLEKCGALASSYDYHFGKFLYEYFPKVTELASEVELAELPDLPLAAVQAFSIDDVTTTEIDDAFSVMKLDNGNWQVGIHIAAPSLGFAPNSALDAIARKRLSTVYFPGGKITMLQEPVIARFTLSAGKNSPAISLYVEIDAADFHVIKSETKIEQIVIAANLHHSELDPVFTEENLIAGLGDYSFKQELNVLWRFATQLEARRGRPSTNQERPEYSFYIDQDEVRIVQRQRGGPLDKLVAELMIYVNSTWGKYLADNNIAAIYRTQSEGRVVMSVYPGAHEGLGVAHYSWASSPLRRYIDLINQWQLLAGLRGEQAIFQHHSEGLLSAMRDFELTYAAYNEFQNHMERYWCLRWLMQEKIKMCEATIIKENLVRFNQIPLYTRVPSLPELEAGSRIVVEVTHIDLWELGLHTQFKKVMEKDEAFTF